MALRRVREPRMTSRAHREARAAMESGGTFAAAVRGTKVIVFVELQDACRGLSAAFITNM
jgi:hypothetical protein